MTQSTEETDYCRRRSSLFVLLFGWFTAVLCISAFLVADDLRSSFSSDIYYLPVLLKDLLQMGGSIAEWRLPPASYLFPDFAIYSLVYAIIRNPVTAIVLCGAAHYLLFIGGCCALASRFARDRRSAFLAQAAVLALASLGLSLDSLRYVAFWSMQISMHFGVIAIAPWFILLVDVLLSARKPLHQLLAGFSLIILSAALTASDLLSVTQILLPSVFTILLLLVLAKTSTRPALVGWVCILSGSFLGANTLQWLGKASLSGYIQPDLVHSSDATRAFLRWIDSFITHQSFAACMALALLALHAGIVLVSIARIARGREANRPLLMLSSFVTCAVIVNVVSVLIMGNFFSSGDARYALTLMFYPLFASPVLLGMLKLPDQLSRHLRKAAAAVFVIILTMNIGYFAKLNELRKYGNFYPDWVSWLDRETRARGLTAGVGPYWDTKELILLSRNELRMVQSTPYLVPYNWISNTKWYDRFEQQFFVCSTVPKETDRVQEKDVVQHFGEPTERLTFGHRSLLIYSQPGSILSTWYRSHPLREEFLLPGSRAVFPAAHLPGDIGTISGTARIAEAPLDRPGSLTLGPYSSMPAGSYRAEIRYSAAPGSDYVSSGYWQLRTIGRSETKLVREAALNPENSIATLDFSLDRRSSVELLTSFTGSGKLVVESISFERIR